MTIVLVLETNKYFTMIELTNHYETAKNKATLFMKNGQLNDYFNALLEMNRYKKLMFAVANN